jgi:hypothetical protein
MLIMQLVSMAIGAVLLVYLLGFSVHPHHVRFALVVAVCYLAFTGAGTFVIQRALRIRTRQAAASGE